MNQNLTNVVNKKRISMKRWNWQWAFLLTELNNLYTPRHSTKYYACFPAGVTLVQTYWLIKCWMVLYMTTMYHLKLQMSTSKVCKHLKRGHTCALSLCWSLLGWQPKQKLWCMHIHVCWSVTVGSQYTCTCGLGSILCVLSIQIINTNILLCRS